MIIITQQPDMGCCGHAGVAAMQVAVRSQMESGIQCLCEYFLRMTAAVAAPVTPQHPPIGTTNTASAPPVVLPQLPMCCMGNHRRSVAEIFHHLSFQLPVQSPSYPSACHHSMHCIQRDFIASSAQSDCTYAVSAQGGIPTLLCARAQVKPKAPSIRAGRVRDTST